MTIQLDRTVVECFEALCNEAGTPLAWKAQCALRRGDWKWLVSIDARPDRYTCPVVCLWDQQIASFFKSYEGLNTGIDLRGEAVKTFWSSEKQCYLTNERLNPLLSDRNHYGERLGSFIGAWRKEIKAVLGPRVSIEEISKRARFGPGSTFLNCGELTLLADKISDSYSSTKPSSPFYPSWDETAWVKYGACGLTTHFGIDPREGPQRDLFGYDDDPSVWDYSIRDLTQVPGNRFTSVKKNSKTDRGICIEPSLNLYFQLGVGALISEKLGRYYGWSKATQPAYHQVLARIGSLTGSISTIDLKAASDSVSRALVKLLLPRDWYERLDQLRCRSTLIDGRWYRIEKFSSMGNGYTFELETLLFLTLCKVLAREPIREDPFTPGLAISVFGDDIIVPTSISKSVVLALSFFGFVVNEEKTYLKGPFRESCGGDYYRGYNVRGYRLPAAPSDPASLLAMANGIKRFRTNLERLCGDRSAGGKAWNAVVRQLPSHIRRLRGPLALGDLVLHDDDWERVNPTVTRSSIRYVRVWRPVHNRPISTAYWRPGVVLASHLFNAGKLRDTTISKVLNGESHPPSDRWIPRISGSFVSGYRFGRVAYS